MYLCICHAVRESDYARYHLIGTNCGKCIKECNYELFKESKKLGGELMHYDLERDQNTGNWWVIHQDDDGFRKIIRTLSADLTYSQAKKYMDTIIAMEAMNV